MKILSLTIVLFFSSAISYCDENKTYEILKNLRCLVCQGQTISDSNSDFAQIIKSVVDDKLQEGLKEKEIYHFLSEKYGSWILLNPPIKTNSYLLWFLPYILFILGGLFIYLMVKKRVIEKK
mgnify:CR=1 FL=1